MIKNSIISSASRRRLNSGDNDGGRERLDSLASSNKEGGQLQNKDSVVALTHYTKRKPSAADMDTVLPNLKAS